MKNEHSEQKRLAAILYNFTLGYGGPVKMSVYNDVFPFILHSGFYENIMHYETFDDTIRACFKEDYHCLQEFKDAMAQDEMITSQALGLALVNRYLSIEQVGDDMMGIALNASVDMYNEPFRLGAWFSEMTHEDIMDCLDIQREKIVILGTDSIGHDLDLSSYDELGDVSIYPDATDEDVPTLIKDATIVCVNKTHLNEANLQTARKLKLICLFATGYNNIDIDYCARRNIMVSNVRGYSSASVAQHTISLLLYLYEKMPYFDNYVKSGRYSNDPHFTFLEQRFSDLEGKVWGIVGLGDIGKRVASLASAFGCEVIYYSTSHQNHDPRYQEVSFDELLERSDVISLHCPLNENTHHLFDEAAFKKMKNSAYFINVARGGCVVEEDLARALINHDIAGAGLDALEVEPMAKNNILLGIRNSLRLVITPHIGWASVEARTRCVEEVYTNIESYINGQPRNLVGRYVKGNR